MDSLGVLLLAVALFVGSYQDDSSDSTTEIISSYRVPCEKFQSKVPTDECIQNGMAEELDRLSGELERVSTEMVSLRSKNKNLEDQNKKLENSTVEKGIEIVDNPLYVDVDRLKALVVVFVKSTWRFVKFPCATETLIWTSMAEVQSMYYLIG